MEEQDGGWRLEVGGWRLEIEVEVKPEPRDRL